MTNTFTTIDNHADTTFNQLLAINDSGVIAGYFGSGVAGHPNKGYTVTPNYGQHHYTNENFPASAQTQVTGINNAGVTVGFEVDAAGNSFGFVDHNGRYALAVDPNAKPIKGLVSEQFLGVNDRGQVAGFYATDSVGDTAGFIYDSLTGAFSAVKVAGATSVTATGINDKGQISGFANIGGKTEGFLESKGHVFTLAGPAGASNVQALGLNDAGIVVGSYVDGQGNTDGFTFNTSSGAYTTIIDPRAATTGTRETVVNGVNDAGQLVGFYLDPAGHTDGMLVTPSAPTFNWFSTTLDDHADRTFNQLLAINNGGEIAGYFGSGADAAHPNQGYTLAAPYGQANYAHENFPGSVQTQVTGLNNAGLTTGFEVDAAGNSLGFVDDHGRFTAAIDPSATALKGPVNEQFLGVNDLGQAAGFYVNDAGGDTTGFIYDSRTGGFTDMHIAGATSITATDINDKGEVSGFYTKGGVSAGFIDSNGQILTIPGGLGDSNVQVLGLNNTGLAVGSFQDGAGHTHGFVYTRADGNFDTFNADHAVGQTVLNGVNDLNQLVGFYMDSAKHSHGLLVTNGAPTPLPGAASALTAMMDTSSVLGSLHPTGLGH